MYNSELSRSDLISAQLLLCSLTTNLDECWIRQVPLYHLTLSQIVVVANKLYNSCYKVYPDVPIRRRLCIYKLIINSKIRSCISAICKQVNLSEI